MSKLNHKFFAWAALSIFAIYLITFLPLPDRIIRVHENADGLLVTYHILSNPSNFFSFSPYAPIPEIMNGVPKMYMFSSLNVIVVLYMFFGSFGGYLVNFLLVRFIGFYGSYVFLRDYFNGKKHLAISILLSICFATLPVFTIYGLTVMGLPMLFYCCLNIYKKEKPKISNYLFLILYGFYSWLVFTGGYIVLAMILVNAWYLFKKKRIHKNFCVATVLLGVVYLIADYSLFTLALGHLDEIQRVKDGKFPQMNFKGLVGMTGYNYLVGHYHAGFYKGILMVPFSLILIVAYRKLLFYRTVIGVLLAGLICSFGLTIIEWDGLNVLYRNIELFNQLNCSRMLFFLPFFVTALFAICIIKVLGQRRIRIISLLVILIVIAWNFRATHRHNTQYAVENGEPVERNKYTFNDYYAIDLFKKIKAHIKLPQDSYNVFSFALPPAVAQYNDFHSLDNYMSLYPNTYKLKMRELLEGELAKSEALTYDFDKTNLMNRCFLKSAELYDGRLEGEKVKNLALDVDVLHELNCKYIFSAMEIQSFSTDKIILDGVFDDESTSRRIHLYKVL